MKIKLSLAVAQKILAYGAATRLEFSGFGFCDRVDGDIFVYDFILMDVGSEGYTEIDPKRILPLLEREDKDNMRVWIHRHPITGWSSRDLQTILKEPLGSTPERVGWSVSIVLTPVGWIGRIDNYIKGITKDLEIEPSVAEAYQEIRELERDRAPFHQGPAGRDGGRVLEAGVQHTDYEYEEDEWDNYEEDDDLEDEGDTCTGTSLQFLLAELALYRSDPASVSLAEVLENYGINWRAIRQKNKR